MNLSPTQFSLPSHPTTPRQPQPPQIPSGRRAKAPAKIGHSNPPSTSEPLLLSTQRSSAVLSEANLRSVSEMAQLPQVVLALTARYPLRIMVHR